MTKIAIYPGTFDPLTLGHLNIIERSLNVADKLIIGVASFSGKEPLFTADERIDIISQSLQYLPHYDSNIVTVEKFDNLLIDFAHQHHATLIIRGLRALSDFEYEFQLANMNKRLDKNIEAIFLMTDEGQHFVSSRLVKEIAVLGGNVSSFVTDIAAEKLREKYEKK